MDQQPAPNINILSFKQQESTGLGKFLNWSLAYGRVVIIVTELIVIAAFISRFYFDTRLSDLHDAISTKENYIKQSQAAADQFLALQTKVNAAGQILDQRKDYSVLLANLNTLIPSDVVITALTVKGNLLDITAQVGSVQSLNILIQNLNNSNKFTDASLGSLGLKDSRLTLTAEATVQAAAYQ